MKADKIKEIVRSRYAKVALRNMPCCGTRRSCCGISDVEDISKKVGYHDMDLNSVPEGANLGLGCGNPVALASLKEGDVVLDLGSGAGFDAFLAAPRVGSSGKVIGVDMTSEMVEKAKANAVKGGFQNVEFRLGEIEDLPVSGSEVDVIISNCVINLSPEKGKVFKEAFRVLKAGGRLMVSDLVLLKPLPEIVGQSVEAYVGCIAGAVMKAEYLAAITAAGFRDLKVVGEDIYPVELAVSDPVAKAIYSDAGIISDHAKEISGSVASIKISAVKPS
ncbi:MAG TPA: arsenite methyltransferase [Deltaproteobacteria bacterium]|jgi:SAM-dependent methyltransferase|nr:arsenite methyltransferase [Deltaproteobacteria bacterium]